MKEGTNEPTNEDSDSNNVNMKTETANPEEEEEEQHARVGDPVGPPARHAPKRWLSPSANGHPTNDAAAATAATNNTNDANQDLLVTEATATTTTETGGAVGTSIVSRLFDPDRKQKPQLWAHIKLVAPGPADQPPPGHIKWRSKDAIAAYCLKCKKQFTYTRGTSKTISRHMQAYHGLVLEPETTATPSAQSTSTATPKRSLDETPAPPLKKRKPDLDQTQLLLLKWVVASFQPWSIVESEGLKPFLQSLSDTFVTPTTEDLLRLAMDHVEAVKLEVRRRLKSSHTYALYCHEFMQASTGQSFTSVSVSFCSPSFQRYSMTLGVLPSPCLPEPVTQLLQQSGLSTSNVTSVTLKDVPASVNLGIGGEETCCLHKMQVLLEEALLSKPAIHDVVASVRAWALTTPTKYSSGIQGLYSMLQAYQADTAVTDHKFLVAVLVSIIRPFYDAHKTLATEAFPTVGLTIPIVRRIGEVLEQWSVDQVDLEGEEAATQQDTDTKQSLENVAKEFYNSLLASFRHSFETTLGPDPPAMWTIPLDPRLVHMGGLSDSEKKTVVEVLVSKVIELRTDGKQQDPEELTSKAKKQRGEESTMGGIFWGDETADQNKAKGDREGITAECQTNVDRYFTAAKSQRRIEDPLQWWSDQRYDFPELSVLAREWLGASIVCPDTSDGRENYPEANVEMIAFLHDNLHLI